MMKFVMISKPKHRVPPELSISLIDALIAYIDKYSKSGHFEDVWSFVGNQGGAAVLVADSFEELDGMVAEYPLGPFSDTEVYPVIDTAEALQRIKAMIQARMAGMGSGGD
jgi:muconolactone delta-isomerase